MGVRGLGYDLEDMVIRQHITDLRTVLGLGMIIEDMVIDMGETRAEIETVKFRLAEQRENKKLQLRLKELQYLQLWYFEQFEGLGGKLVRCVSYVTIVALIL